MNDNKILEKNNTLHLNKNGDENALVPTKKELAVLNSTEKIGFRLMHRMNQGVWKNFWTFCHTP